MVILDTNIVIDHLRQIDKTDSVLLNFVKQNPDEALGLSVISVAELYEGKSTQNIEKEKMLLATITPLTIIPYDYVTAAYGGRIARDLGRPIELADAAIAATAILKSAPLLTLNKKDFPLIPKLQLYEI